MSSSSSNPPLQPLPPPLAPTMLYIGAGFDLSPLLTFAPGGSPYPIQPLADSFGSGVETHGYSYSSFVFVDAKPRHTFACMVDDFEEWESLDGRATNVIHYAQGMLDRWRTVPGSPDLILFEGGGTRSQVQERLNDPAWHFSPWRKKKKKTGIRVLRRRTRSCDVQVEGAQSKLPRKKNTESTQHEAVLNYFDGQEQRPLTTLYYLFNTLDVEIMQTPRMELIWENIEALYVHGLKIHPCTGRGLRDSFHSTTASLPPSGRSSPPLDRLLPLAKSLKRCFVLPGSWSGPHGVQHVDFVRQARERMLCEQYQRREAKLASSPQLRMYRYPYLTNSLPLVNVCPFIRTRLGNPFTSPPSEDSGNSSYSPSPFLTLSPFSSLSSISLSPMTFSMPSSRRARSPRRKRTAKDNDDNFNNMDLAFSWSDDDSNAAEVEDDDNNNNSSWNTPPTSPSVCPSRSSLSLDPIDSEVFEPFGFHIPIPQISYSQRLTRNIMTIAAHDAQPPKCSKKASKVKGRYFIARSVTECLQIIKARGKTMTQQKDTGL